MNPMHWKFFILTLITAPLPILGEDNEYAPQSKTPDTAVIPDDVDAETEPASFYELPEMVVWESRVAREEPIGTFPMPISALAYEPQVDVQGRTFVEAQADVSIRGGTFEQTGFNLGSAGLWDPQTGHYFAEIPVTPNMLTRPVVYTGLDSALYGFNSTAGVVDFDWLALQGSTMATSAGGGNNGLLYATAYGALLIPVTNTDYQVGFDFESAYSSASGPRPYSSSEFMRYNGRLQLLTPRTQTDLFFGYQSKQFGWPQMYVSTGIFNEQENIQSNLFLINQKVSYGDDDSLEITGYARRNKDYYVLQQTNPAMFNAQHESWVYSGAIQGSHHFDLFDVRYMTQFSADTLDSSNLFAAPPYRLPATGNGVYSQSLYKLSVLPEKKFKLHSEWDLTLQAGGTFDYSNRHGSAGSPLAGAMLTQLVPGKGRNDYYLSFAKSTQVPTGTATGASTTGGVFRGNPGLGREHANNMEVGIAVERDTWRVQSAIFYRQDTNLTDWVFSPSVPAARFATPVNVDTIGIEIIGFKRWDPIDLIAGYSYLNKTENNNPLGLDASFYSGNYARHRFTLAAVWRIMDCVEIRSDNEFRVQAPNSIRLGTRTPVLSSVGIYYFPPQVPSLELSLAVDNLFNQAYQEVPGVPSWGRQISAGAALRF